MDVLEDSLEELLKGMLKVILKSLLCRLYQVIFHTPASPGEKARRNRYG